VDEFPVPLPVGSGDSTGVVQLEVGTALLDVRVQSSRISSAHIEGLVGDERDIASRMAPGRAAEFASGRRLLRRLLKLDGPLPRDSDGRPTYPLGTPPASMSHDGDLVVAVVVEQPRLASGVLTSGVGVDICAQSAANSRGVSEQLLRAEEAGLDPTLALVIKEASFKAMSPGMRRRPTSFLDLLVNLDTESAVPQTPGQPLMRFLTRHLDGGAGRAAAGAVWNWGERFCAIAVATQ
jgi:4'-phosphopantetheinyl transferase EntD